MKEIFLTRGYVALVDDDDYDEISRYSWHVNIKKNTCYAQTSFYHGVKCTVKMHRVILGIDDPKIIIDHIDGNGLNNTRGNLRTATASENNYHKKGYPERRKHSVYKGVTKNNYGHWCVEIAKEGRRFFVGVFINRD
jgi:hypothetical protein